MPNIYPPVNAPVVPNAISALNFHVARPMLKPESTELFKRLMEIVRKLRSPEGCPWDRAQTPETIAPYLLEETHEAIEAIHSGDRAGLRDELGDILLEVALLSTMAEEEGSFDIGDCLKAVTEKLVRRHPHVFGPGAGEPSDVESIGRKWSEIKAAEKPDRKTLDGVPRGLPALHRARRVSEKAAGVGFDWDSSIQVLQKVVEELDELKTAMAEGDKVFVEEELGDLLFSLVNLARHLKIDPERSLDGTTDKFLARFAHVEGELKKTGRTPHQSTLEEMNDLWEAAKTKVRP